MGDAESKALQTGRPKSDWIPEEPPSGKLFLLGRCQPQVKRNNQMGISPNRGIPKSPKNVFLRKTKPETGCLEFRKPPLSAHARAKTDSRSCVEPGNPQFL